MEGRGCSETNISHATRRCLDAGKITLVKSPQIFWTSVTTRSSGCADSSSCMTCSRTSVPMAENMAAYLDTWSAFFLTDILPGIFSYLHNIDNRQVGSNEDAFQQSSATVVRLAFGFAQSSGQAGAQNPISNGPGATSIASYHSRS